MSEKVKETQIVHLRKSLLKIHPSFLNQSEGVSEVKCARFRLATRAVEYQIMIDDESRQQDVENALNELKLGLIKEILETDWSKCD